MATAASIATVDVSVMWAGLEAETLTAVTNNCFAKFKYFELNELTSACARV